MINKKWEVNFIPPSDTNIEYINLINETKDFIFKMTGIPTNKPLVEIRSEKIQKIKENINDKRR